MPEEKVSKPKLMPECTRLHSNCSCRGKHFVDSECCTPPAADAGPRQLAGNFLLNHPDYEKWPREMGNSTIATLDSIRFGWRTVVKLMTEYAAAQAVPQESRELTKAEWKEIAEGPCEAEDDDLSLDAKLAERDKTVVSDWKADLLDTGAEFILINGKRHWAHDAKEIVRLHNAQLAEKEREIPEATAERQNWITAINVELADLRSRWNAAERRAEAAEQRLQEAQAEIATWQSSAAERQRMCETLHADLATLRERLRQREAELEQLRAQISGERSTS